MRIGMRGRAQWGFTWLELLVVIVLLGALVAVAIPSHRIYTQRVNRADAASELLSYAQILDRCFQRGQDYRLEDRGSVAPCVTLPATNAEGTYRIEFAPGEPTGATFRLVATPLDLQAADSQCGSFTLDHAGQRDIIGGRLDAQRCWQQQAAQVADARSD